MWGLQWMSVRRKRSAGGMSHLHEDGLYVLRGTYYFCLLHSRLTPPLQSAATASAVYHGLHAHNDYDLDMICHIFIVSS
jgi:hypothetical protein